MKESLASTVYCDHVHPAIRAAAAELKAGDGDPKRVALRTFTFVRDKLLFGFDFYRRRSSETLQRGYGACWNKALLLVALLRCNRIPARFGSIPMKRTFIQPAIGAWHRLANDPFNHCMVHAYLNDRWIILDAVLDKATYATFYRSAGVQWGIDWNGEDDVRLYTDSVAGPPVMHRDIDATVDRKVSNSELPGCLAAAGNWHVNKALWKKIGQRPTPWNADAAVDNQHRHCRGDLQA